MWGIRSLSKRIGNINPPEYRFKQDNTTCAESVVADLVVLVCWQDKFSPTLLC
jgi:hypothetical protein